MPKNESSFLNWLVFNLEIFLEIFFEKIENFKLKHRQFQKQFLIFEQ